jgi:cytochrome c oxidase subunit IV
MAQAVSGHGYRGYWIIWAVLLTATVSMVFIGESQMHEASKALLLLVGSSIKATLIIFFYMHLRFERLNLILVVLVGIFVTGILMFAIPAYDGSTNILLHRLYQ